MDKNGEVKVSVIIPVYNMQEYMGECINSVRRQSLHEIEIICIDDGSRDNSYDILKENAKEDKRIKIIRQQNQGVAAARNLGIREAVGKYILFMDADDMYPNERVIELLFSTAEEKQVVIAGGQFSDIDISGQINTAYSGLLQGYIFEKSGLISYQDYQFDYGYHRFLYNREFLLKNNIFFPEYVRYQDPPFMVKAMTMAEYFYALKEVSYCYRMDYKVIEWNEKRVCGLLRGLRDNLQWAGKYNLCKLYELTMMRLVNEYRKVIVEQTFVSAKVLRILLQLHEEAITKEDKEAIRQMLLEGYEKQRSCRIEVSKEYERISTSISYRIGLAVTYIPRRVYKGIRNLFQKKYSR
ncbi:MAG: glycosyltransferase family 2 protein [Lachnospiraceae bacterium]|nr:glycosyltransferase family 2 protein [Lachnospiraceae bacterium]